jgi:DNA-directed RNA polymerase alpha subunit
MVRVARYEVSGAEVSVRITESGKEFVNLLRYGIISCIPVPGFKSVTIQENSSILSDTMLAHRLNLIPLSLDSALGGKVSIDISCDPGTSRIVRARDMVCVGCAFERDDEVLVHLYDGAKVRLSATVTLNKGKQHASFSPVAAARFVPDAQIKVSPKCLAKMSTSDKLSVAQSCPRSVFTADLDIEDAGRCIFCKRCEDATVHTKAVRVTPSEESFLFKFECIRGNSGTRILLASVDELINILQGIMNGLGDN